MTDHPIKVTLLNALLLCCLQGILAGAVLAGVISLGQEGSPAGKRKSLHEYGPEDVHPGAQENENSAPRKRQALQPKGRNLAPLAPRSNELKPAVTPLPMPTVTPAPVESTVAPSTVAPSTVAPSSVMPTAPPTPTPRESSAPATALTRSAPQKVKDSDEFRRKLLVSSFIFLLLFTALVFFAIKMWRQLRAGGRAARESASQEQLPGAERRQLRIVGQGAPEKRVNRSDINTKGLKTKTQDGRRARIKKA
jgi:hypothetical protein